MINICIGIGRLKNSEYKRFVDTLESARRGDTEAAVCFIVSLELCRIASHLFRSIVLHSTLASAIHTLQLKQFS